MGRRAICAQALPLPNRAAELCDILLLAGLRKSLSRPKGLRDIDPSALPSPLPDAVVLSLLRHPALEPDAKLTFFRWAASLPSYSPSPDAHSTLLRLLAHTGRLDDLRSLLRHALASGGPNAVDPSTFQSLLTALLRAGRLDSAIGALGDAEELGATASLNPQTYGSIILTLLKKSQLDLALSMFQKLLDSFIKPDVLVCNELLVALRRADMRGEFRKVFDELTQRRFPLNAWTYNICIHAFGSWGQLGTALSLFKEMNSKGSMVAPDICTYNSVMHALCSGGMVKDALIVYHEMKESGHEPDRFTYQTLIHGCFKTYRIDEAIRVFREMKYNNVRANTIVYNYMIDGLLKVRKLNDACNMFEEMVSDGVRASCYTYNILIDGLIRNGQPSAAFTLFNDLKKKGNFVDGVSYSIIISQYCEEGGVEEALDLADEMIERGFVVDWVTTKSLLTGLPKIGMRDAKDHLLKRFRDCSMMPSLSRWKANMKPLVKDRQDKGKDFTAIFPSVGDLSEIMSWVNMLPEDDIGDLNVYPESKDEWSSFPYLDQIADKFKSLDVSLKFTLCRGQRVQDKGIKSFQIDAMNTSLSIYLAKRKLSKALKYYEKFTLLGHKPSAYTYNSLMSSFVNKGYLKDAWGVLEEMGGNLCPADIATCNVIIQGLGKMGKADLVCIVLNQLLKKGGYLDIVMYNTLINALGKVGRIDEANKLFEQMIGSGINPDVVTFNTLIEVHAKSGRIKDAKKYIRKMLASGYAPNHVTHTIFDFLMVSKDIYET